MRCMAIQDAGLPFRALVVTLAGAVGFVSGATALSMEAPCEDLDADGYVAGPGCAVQEDCNDQSAAIRPGVEESCNGWDDDCDGELDEGCDRVCEDFGLNRRVFLNDNAGQDRKSVV